MEIPSIHGWRRRTWMAGAVDDRIQRRDVRKDTMEVPIDGTSFHPWIEDIHG